MYARSFKRIYTDNNHPNRYIIETIEKTQPYQTNQVSYYWLHVIMSHFLTSEYLWHYLDHFHK